MPYIQHGSIVVEAFFPTTHQPMPGCPQTGAWDIRYCISVCIQSHMDIYIYIYISENLSIYTGCHHFALHKLVEQGSCTKWNTLIGVVPPHPKTKVSGVGGWKKKLAVVPDPCNYNARARTWSRIQATQSFHVAHAQPDESTCTPPPGTQDMACK